jgi:hypothetical protein
MARSESLLNQFLGEFGLFSREAHIRRQSRRLAPFARGVYEEWVIIYRGRLGVNGRRTP